MSRSEILARFEKYTVQATPQRIEIAEVLLARPQHVSAEQIIDELRVRHSAVSKATVYNTLNLFAEKGLIKELLVDPERRIYDSSSHAHHHFYNVDTGQLSDIDDDALQLIGLPELPEGTMQDSVEVLIKVRNR